MSEVKQWSQVDADNDDATKGGWPEGMNRSDVNDRNRENLGAVRRFFENGEWVDLLKEHEGDFTVSRGGVKVFVVTDAGGADASLKFPTGSWVKVTGTGGNTPVYGDVLTAVYSGGAGTTTVTLDTCFDANYAVSADIPTTTVTLVECFWSRRTRQAAFHPVGATLSQAPAEIPSIDELGDGATLDQGTGNGFDADTVDGLHASAFQLSGGSAHNAIINGSFQVWQRGLGFTQAADNVLTADRWVVLGETAHWDVDQETINLPAGAYRGLRLTANGTTTSKVGILQVITGGDSRPIVGAGAASLSFDVLCPTSTGIGDNPSSGIRAAVLEWSGTEDTLGISRDIVNMWSVEGTDPTLVTNWAYANTPSVDEHAQDDAWTRVEIENITITAGTKNLAVFIWIEDKTFGGTDAVRFANVQLVPGTLASNYQYRHLGQEVDLCLPFYQKTYEPDVAPQTITGIGALEVTAAQRQVGAYAANVLTFHWRLATPMRANPVYRVWDPVTGTENFADDTLGPVLATAAINYSTPGRHGATFLVGNAPSSLGIVTCHVTVEAEL